MGAFSVFSRKVFHMGPVGAGMAAKIARNVATYGAWLASYEAGLIAENAGIEISKLVEATDESDPNGVLPLFLLRRSNTVRPRAANESEGVEGARHGMSLMRKDLDAARALAADTQTDLVISEIAWRLAPRIFRIVESAPEDDASRMDQGRSLMESVYGFAPTGPPQTKFGQHTIEHLFGEIWSREGLALRDRRLLVLGVAASLGRGDIVELHASVGLERGDFTRSELEEIVLHLAYYVGWPNAVLCSKAINSAMETRDRDSGHAD